MSNETEVQMRNSEVLALPGVLDLGGSADKPVAASYSGPVFGLAYDASGAEGDRGCLQSLARWSKPGPKCSDKGIFSGRDDDDSDWRDGGGFFGSPRIPTVAAYSDFFRSGWAGGVEAMRAAVKDVRLPSADRTFSRRIRYRDEGDELDVQRAIARGDTDGCWQDAGRQEGSSGVDGITIAVNVTSSAGVDAKSMIWRGVTAVGLCDALQASGVPIRVIAYFQTKDGYTAEVGSAVHAFSSMVLKDYAEEVNLDKIAIGCGHPATLRVALFAAMYSNPHFATHYGLGNVIPGAPIVNDGSALIVVDECLDKSKALAMLDVYIEEIEAGRVRPEAPLLPKAEDIADRIKRRQQGDFK